MTFREVGTEPSDFVLLKGHHIAAVCCPDDELAMCTPELAMEIIALLSDRISAKDEAFVKAYHHAVCRMANSK